MDAKKSINCWKGCDAELAAGLSAFSSELLPSHSLTSRRYSIWTALRRHVDQPFARTIASFSLPWHSSLLDGFSPSAAWRSPGQHVLNQLALEPEARHSLIKARPNAEQHAEIESVLIAMERWEECLRFAIRSAQEANACNTAGRAVFASSLGTVSALLRSLRSLRPRYGNDAKHGRLADATTRPDQGTFCELCWRESMRSKALRSPIGKASDGRLSSRFCETHDPSCPTSRYRVDLRYKEPFQAELNALYGFCESTYEFRFSLPRSADEQEVRKTAYDLVHSRLRTLESVSAGSKERVYALHREGLRQAEIARQLGVSRQAVSKALKDLESLVQARQEDAELSYSTGEPLSLSEDSAESIRSEILRLCEKGFSVAQIARRLNRYRHTIDAIVRSHLRTSRESHPYG